MTPITIPAARHIRLVALLAVSMAVACAADSDIRLIPQLAVGTSGFEPGLALEWRGSNHVDMIVRPELLISEDGDIGGGGSVLYDLTPKLGLRAEQSVAVGPRVVYHNAEDTGWEASALGTWSYDLSRGPDSWQHAVGVLAALGLSQDRRHDDADIAATAGVFYAFHIK
jgi:hypothetical protein